VGGGGGGREHQTREGGGGGYAPYAPTRRPAHRFSEANLGGSRGREDAGNEAKENEEVRCDERGRIQQSRRGRDAAKEGIAPQATERHDAERER